MKSNFRPNILLTTNILVVIATFVFRKIKFLSLFIFISLNFNSYSHAHMKGTYSSEQEALKKSLELGCKGTHKNQEKWLPCKNEKELHIFLRK